MNELDLKTLWKELDEFENEIEKEATSLKNVWIKIASLKRSNEQDIDTLLQNEELDFVEPATVIEVNVGGQIFEISAETLIREPFSILAALCRKKPLIGGDVIYIDRDWWIFRHVLAYLKSNVLPTELDILQELYREATFYRLDGLKKAIENTPLHEVTSPANRFATTKEERSSVR